jgi:hypothetical protein
MNRTNLFLKVQVEHEPDDNPSEIAEEICRLLMKAYGVRKAELSSFTQEED